MSLQPAGFESVGISTSKAMDSGPAFVYAPEDADADVQFFEREDSVDFSTLGSERSIGEDDGPTGIIRTPPAESDGGNAADYASSVSLSRMLYGHDLLDWIGRRRPRIASERQSGGPVTFPPPNGTGERKITVVRAPMGSGKTTALIEWLKKALRGPDMSALVVSCRRSFTHTLAKRFNDAGLTGFVTYFASTDYVIRGSTFKRLMIQAESLHRVDKSLLRGYEVLVLDEAMSIVGQLYSPTMRRIREVDDALTWLLRSCPRVLAMDATINAQFVDTLCELRGEENIRVILGQYAAPGFSARKCTVLRSMGTQLAVRTMMPAASTADETRDSEVDRVRDPTPEDDGFSFFGELHRRLMAGDNLCVFASTLSFSEIVFEFCKRATDSVLLLNSEQAEPVDVSTWSAYRVVVYTTVVTVGLSFEDRHFHAMFAYVKPSGHGPDMASVYQSLGRVRSLINNEVFLYIDGSSSRCDAVFTPMLLNHVISDTGDGWPTSFVQITNAACCSFRRDCVPTFPDADGMYIFQKFKYKHLFERCTLSSLGDSINILHALLAGNNMTVEFYGCPAETLNARSFERMLRDVRVDSIQSQRALREVKDVIASQRAGHIDVQDVAMEEDVNAFAQKYLRPSVPPEALHDLLTRLKDPIFRDRFANVAVLEACLGIPSQERCDDAIDAAYRSYGTGRIPYASSCGKTAYAEVCEDFNISSRRDAFRSCAIVAETLRWKPSSDASDADTTPEEIGAAVSSYKESLRRLLLEIPRCYASGETAALSKPARKIAAVLNGAAFNDAIRDEQDYCMELFKVVWEEMFGAHLVKSTRRFPGGVKLKNLRKSEIEHLLDVAGVNRDGLGTHKQLYAALMANKAAFSQRRYRIKRPKWYGWLNPTKDTGDTNVFRLALDASICCDPGGSRWRER